MTLELHFEHRGGAGVVRAKIEINRDPVRWGYREHSVPLRRGPRQRLPLPSCSCPQRPHTAAAVVQAPASYRLVRAHASRYSTVLFGCGLTVDGTRMAHRERQRIMDRSAPKLST